jgi:hypothetical protein
VNIRNKLPRIESLHFDHRENLKRARIQTRFGRVDVEWHNVSGDRCWFSAGAGDARQEAVPAIERIECLMRQSCA